MRVLGSSKNVVRGHRPSIVCSMQRVPPPCEMAVIRAVSAQFAKFFGPTTITALDKSNDDEGDGGDEGDGVESVWIVDHGPVFDGSDARVRQK